MTRSQLVGPFSLALRCFVYSEGLSLVKVKTGREAAQLIDSW